MKKRLNEWSFGFILLNLHYCGSFSPMTYILYNEKAGIYEGIYWFLQCLIRGKIYNIENLSTKNKRKFHRASSKMETGAKTAGSSKSPDVRHFWKDTHMYYKTDMFSH